MTDENIKISVVPVQDDDYAKWLPYWVKYQQFYEVQLPEETTIETWKRFFDADKDIHCAVVKKDKPFSGLFTMFFMVQPGL